MFAHVLADNNLKHLRLAGGSGPLAMGGDQVAVVSDGDAEVPDLMARGHTALARMVTWVPAPRRPCR